MTQNGKATESHHDDDRDHHDNSHDDDDDCHHTVPCFIAGSKVATINGHVPVEQIRQGMKVLTIDNSYKEVAWSSSTTAVAEWVEFGNTRVSANHRMLMSDHMPEHFIAAKKLARAGQGKLIISKVTFVHFMFDQHEIVNVDGVWSESFYPGSWIMQALPSAQSKEIYALFPELKYNQAPFELARPELHKLVA